jgi:hypothetical protein
MISGGASPVRFIADEGLGSVGWRILPIALEAGPRWTLIAITSLARPGGVWLLARWLASWGGRDS